MQSETLKKTKAAKFFAAVLTAVVLASAAAAIPVCAVLTAGEARPVIVVDAGHGGLDGGVVGTRTGVKESDLNLAVALLLGGMLEEDGFDVVFTRAGKGGLYLDGERGKKSADMRRRADIIARSGAVGVVSIHMNTFSDSSRRGAQVFFRRVVFPRPRARGCGADGAEPLLQSSGRGQGVRGACRRQIHPATDLRPVRHRGMRLSLQPRRRKKSFRRGLPRPFRPRSRGRDSAGAHLRLTLRDGFSGDVLTGFC